MERKIYFVGEGIVNGETVHTDKFNQILNPETMEQIFEDVFQITECADFEKYEKKIGETNEFSELKKNASNYSIKDLEKECLYIVGLYSFDNEPKQNTETPVDNSIKFSATHDNGEIEDPIEATYKKYLNK